LSEIDILLETIKNSIDSGLLDRRAMV